MFLYLYVKSPTSDRWWPDNVFISGGNPHLTSQFCGVVLGPTTIPKRRHDVWSLTSKNCLHTSQNNIQLMSNHSKFTSDYLYSTKYDEGETSCLGIILNKEKLLRCLPRHLPLHIIFYNHMLQIMIVEEVDREDDKTK